MSGRAASASFGGHQALLDEHARHVAHRALAVDQRQQERMHATRDRLHLERGRARHGLGGIEQPLRHDARARRFVRRPRFDRDPRHRLLDARVPAGRRAHVRQRSFAQRRGREARSGQQLAHFIESDAVRMRGARERERAGVDPASARLEREIHPRRDARERLADDVDEPRRHDGIERTVGERRLQRVGGHELESGSRHSGRRELAQYRVILERRGAIGNSYSSTLRPANTSRATNSSSGLKSVATVSGASPCHVQVVREAPGTGAVHQRPAEPCERATEHRPQLLESAGVLRLAPAPVAVHIDVVVSQALLQGQARAEPVVRRERGAVLEPERREQRAQAFDLVLVCRGHVIEAPPGRRNDVVRGRRDVHRRGLGGQVLESIPRRPRHSASACRGSGNSHGISPMTGKPLLHASHIQPARANVIGPRRQRGQARTLDRVDVSSTMAGNAGGSARDGQSVPRARDNPWWLVENPRMNTANPYAPPRAKVVDIPVDHDAVELAGVGVRLGAYIIDTLIVWMVVLVPLIVAIWLSFDRSRGIGVGIAWLAFLVCAVVVAGFNIFYLLRNGQTIAKKWLGIRIVRADGSEASFSRIFWLRGFVNGLITGAFGLYFIVDSLLIFGEARQCVHDKIADTIVVVA